MDPDKAAANLQVIRQLMERPVRYSTQSGLAAILAGVIALAGLWADSYFYSRYGMTHEAFWINLRVWGCVFLLALAGTLGLTRLRELRQGMPFWTPAKRKLLVTVLAPFVAGVGFTAAVAWNWWSTGQWEQIGLVFPAWMLFYGLACWQVSQYSTREIGLLGAAFVLAGLVSAAFFQGYPYLTLGVSFGGFHIVYGIGALIKYGI